MTPLDTEQLLPELRSLVTGLSEDMLARVNAGEGMNVPLRDNFERIQKSGRTGQPYEVWLEDYLDQVAVAWVLACVFVRFIEDNGLLNEAWIAGEGDRKNLADGNYEIYFRTNPRHSDREFLQYVFRQIGKIPAAAELFDETKTPLWAVDPSGDMARRLLSYFKEIDPNQGGLKRRFTTVDRNTQSVAQIYQDLAPQAQFLGDLYQDLSEHARKKYALLQTPEFVARFLLDSTVTRAIDTFGLRGLRLIDPTCGSGHLLLGAFDRLFKEWCRPEYGVSNPVVAAQNALDSLHGVDLNPFAVAITRFRLLVAAIQACGIGHLNQQTFAWKLNLAVGDSLLYGSKPSRDGVRVPIGHQNTLYDPDANLAIEQSADARRILGQGYHIVVGNPPYITPKDRVLNERYRKLYPDTCHMKYSLGVPFTQRFFELAIRQDEQFGSSPDGRSPSPGYVGIITANSFMKREFGKKLIESFFPQTDLTHVIDTAGAYIPGHGTPTVILFGRPRKPVERTVRTAMGIAGEPSTPADPAHGLVWSSIVELIDRPGEQSKYVSIADTPRESFAKHPWSIGGGGASELKEILDEGATASLAKAIELTGVLGMTNADEVMLAPPSAFRRQLVEPTMIRQLALGDEVRDWLSQSKTAVLFPYEDEALVTVESRPGLKKWLWPCRTVMGNRATFGGLTYFMEGRPWWEWHQLAIDRLRTPLTIVFAEVATHNHFVLERSGNVFKQTAPLIKLPAEASEDDHLALLGLLNSSTACFWMRQACFPKGGHGIGRGIQDENWESRFAFNASNIEDFPLPKARPLKLCRELDRIAREYASLLPEVICRQGFPFSKALESARQRTEVLRGKMIALQEELDWHCYRLYGLCDDTALELAPDGWDAVSAAPGVDPGIPPGGLFQSASTGSEVAETAAPSNGSFLGATPADVINDEIATVPSIQLGWRAFEIVLARGLQSGEMRTTWFTRHGSTPATEIPRELPATYREVVRKRIERIETDKTIALLEKPEYKRRWKSESWEVMQERALREWLLDRLEKPRYRRGTPSRPEPCTTAQMSDVAAADAEFVGAATVYRGRADFDLPALVAELVDAEAVPFLPVLRYRATGLRKRALWARTWALQRQQDAGGDVGPIDVPPKYVSADFLNTDYWRLRGKLDVPKERWVSFPHCSTDGDQSLLVAWAGWNQLEQATALVSYYDARKREGWDAKRLTPLLAGLLELLPWIHQWHPEVDPEFGETAGQSFQHMLEADAHELGLTMDDIRNWTPPEKTKTVRRKKETA